jgi:hypothetical protein
MWTERSESINLSNRGSCHVHESRTGYHGIYTAQVVVADRSADLIVYDVIVLDE